MGVDATAQRRVDEASALTESAREISNGVITQSTSKSSASPLPTTKYLTLSLPGAQSKADIVDRIGETRTNLMDLIQRQYHDMVDEASAGAKADIDDMDKLLTEMKTVKGCIETMNMLEAAIRRSKP